jgi:recombination protein RecA
LDLGVGMGLVEKRGSFYTYGEQRIGQGRENARGYLKDNPALADELEAKVRVAFDGHRAPEPSSGAGDPVDEGLAAEA